MKRPTPVVLYVPDAQFDDDTALPSVLSLIGASHISLGPSDSLEAVWADIAIRARMERAAGFYRLILELRETTWLDMIELDEYGAFVEPARFRRFVDAFARAADDLACPVAFRASWTLPEDEPSWDPHHGLFDAALDLGQWDDPVLSDISVGYVSKQTTRLRFIPTVELGWVGAFLNGFETERGYVWFNDDTPPAWPLPEWDYDRVYSAPAATGWPHRWWGLWPQIHYLRTGRRDIADHLDDYRDESVPQAIQSFLADYLQATPPVLVASEDRANPARCELCDEPIPINRFHSDDEWWWPGDLGHYVRTHHVVVPNEMAAHIVAADGIPPDVDDLTADVDDVPWPPKVFPDDPPWPHQAAAERPDSGWRVFHPDGTITEPDGTTTRPDVE